MLARVLVTAAAVHSDILSLLGFTPLLEYLLIRNLPSLLKLGGLQCSDWSIQLDSQLLIGQYLHCFGSWPAPKLCNISWTRLSTPILRGILLVCLVLRVMKRLLRLTMSGLSSVARLTLF